MTRTSSSRRAFLAGAAVFAGSPLLSKPAMALEEYGIRVNSFMPTPRPTGAGEAPALMPMEWIRAHRLTLSCGPDGKVALDRTATTTAFARQLGETYVGLKSQPVHVQALAVTSNLSRMRDKRVQGLKESLAEIWTLNPRAEAETKTAELIAPYLADQKMTTGIEKIMGGHAFVNSAMMGLFEAAKKEGGVLACGEILWVKKIDRPLWYTLQNVGRHAYFIEGAGARSHFFAERVSGEPKVEPYVGEAVFGLKDYLIKQGITDLQDYINSRKPKE